MSDYTKTTNFAAKDSLPSGNSGKIVKGSEIDTEFTNIQTAVATKLDINNSALTGTTTAQTLDISGNVDVDGTLETDALSLNGVTVTSTAAELNYVDGVTSNIQTQLDTKAPLASPTFTGTVTVPGLTTTGNVGIGTSSPDSYLAEGSNLVIADSGHAGITLASGTTSEGGIFFADGTSGSDRFRGMIRYNHTSNYMEFRTDAGERMRIDSSGNSLVGTTSVPSQSTGVSSGVYFVVKGDIIPSVDAGLTGHSDLGDPSTRYEDAYVRDGVTTGSDGRDKQDIEELSDAEQRVAVACKGLLRKWRWKSSVAEKGDDARIHFGIIAQDLQAAFEAEGLEAGRYAMFINSTWTDEDTGEERTRLGVRYSELLAFIISAI